jgi:hypothetical protein
MTKRLMVTVVAVVLAVPGMVQAQASQVTATATVANYSAISGTGDLAFGTLSRVADNTIDATGAGAATRTLNYNHNVRVTYANVPAVLLANGGSLTLAVALTCAARVGTAAWSTAAACSGAQHDLDVGTALTEATLGFGGTITAANAANAVAGTYAATLDIVVTAR